MPSHPLAEAETLVERLARISTAEVVDEYTLRQAEADAEGLIRTDAAQAHSALAMVAALRWGVDEMRRQHEAGIALQDSRPNANAFTMVGEIDGAYRAACGALAKMPDDPIAMRHAIEAAVQDARFRDASVLCERWVRQSPQEQMPLRQSIGELVEAVEQGAFTEAGAREVLRTASALRRDARIRCSGFSIQPSVEDPGTFGFNYDVIASTEEASDLNCALAERWAGSPALQADPGLAFVPMFIGRNGNGRHP